MLASVFYMGSSSFLDPTPQNGGLPLVFSWKTQRQSILRKDKLITSIDVFFASKGAHQGGWGCVFCPRPPTRHPIVARLARKSSAYNVGSSLIWEGSKTSETHVVGPF